MVVVTVLASRQSVSVALSIVLHAMVLALLLRHQVVVELAMPRAPLLLSLVPAGTRTAGPGIPSDRLQSAAASAPAAAQPPAPPKDSPAPAVIEPAAKVETGNETPAPAPPLVAAPKKNKTAKPPAPQPAPAIASVAPASAAATADGRATGGDSGSGAVASAPSWGESAGVRYLELLSAWLHRHKEEYPVLAKRRGLQGHASVRIRIDRSGRVLEASIVRSTGQDLLDQAALDLVRRASPFPAIPPEYPDASFEFDAPVDYGLH
ncbi:MAG TPA: energy transducer TonB [Candidatus Binatia bacterium]